VCLGLGFRESDKCAKTDRVKPDHYEDIVTSGSGLLIRIEIIVESYSVAREVLIFISNLLVVSPSTDVLGPLVTSHGIARAYAEALPCHE